ncbi:hypothetical protein GQX74_012447 [Glossina fuscipes]|nr:hypothetical protein GQX74_012447 [Glossina fuscipes]
MLPCNRILNFQENKHCSLASWLVGLVGLGWLVGWLLACSCWFAGITHNEKKYGQVIKITEAQSQAPYMNNNCNDDDNDDDNDNDDDDDDDDFHNVSVKLLNAYIPFCVSIEKINKVTNSC